MELKPPFINEPKVKELPELTIIPPAEIIPPTTFGQLPFGFVPIIELPCVVALSLIHISEPTRPY